MKLKGLLKKAFRRKRVEQFKDRKLVCENPSCKKEFVFTVGEQKFFLQKAFAEPRRCPDCRKDRKKDRRKRRRQLIKSLSTKEAVNVEVEDTVETQESVASVEEPKNDEEKSKEHEAEQTEETGPDAVQEETRGEGQEEEGPQEETAE